MAHEHTPDGPMRGLDGGTTADVPADYKLAELTMYELEQLKQTETRISEKYGRRVALVAYEATDGTK